MMLSKLLILLVGAAQPTFAVTLAAVLFTYHGERTPVLTSDSFVPTYNLTTLGANQMFKAGSYVRSRYISGNNSTRTAIIAGIDPSTIDNAITTVLTRDETYISSGALAFMQGLYPPTTEGASQEVSTSYWSRISGRSNH